MSPQKRRSLKSHFCTACGEEMSMEVVRRGVRGDVTWLRCPCCGGLVSLLPKGLQQGGAPPVRTVSPEEDLRSYSPQKSFFIGEVIYHPGFDDLGRVIDKEISGSGNQAIVVSFVKEGKKKLVEGIELPAL